ncbi:transposase [Streptomyces sp. NPDC002870]|uniref:helix-turn-helix domain-containing protein n=1 Tax=Streptomyces sp. NPDC002870 TaxID=3364666 RepID=UPI0036A923ED
MSQVADLLECNPVTVRDAVHRFTGGGFDALADAPRPGRPAQITDDDLKALGVLLDASAEAGVTWTAPSCATGWPWSETCAYRRRG